MNIIEMRSKNNEELSQEVGLLLRAQFGLRTKKAMQQLENTSLLKKQRREIARICTVLTEKRRDAKVGQHRT